MSTKLSHQKLEKNVGNQIISGRHLSNLYDPTPPHIFNFWKFQMKFCTYCHWVISRKLFNKILLFQKKAIQIIFGVQRWFLKFISKNILPFFICRKMIWTFGHFSRVYATNIFNKWHWDYKCHEIATHFPTNF